jgi:hypothetical protein
MKTNIIRSLHESRAALRPPEWLVQDFIETGSLTNIVAPPASYKSFVALGLGASVASGIPFHDSMTRQGRVLYLCGEGLRGFHNRAEAWENHNNQNLDATFDVLENTFKLQVYEECVQFLRDLAARSNKSQSTGGPSLKPDLLIIDTLARYSAGVEENSAKEMGSLIENVTDLFIRQNNMAVILVHHTGRQGSHSRGSSAVDGALDFEYKLTAQKGGEDGSSVSIYCSKSKDHEQFPTRTFKLEAVPVRPNTTATSLVVSDQLENTSDNENFKPLKFKGQQKTIHDAILSLLVTKGRNPDFLSLTRKDVAAICGDNLDRTNFNRNCEKIWTKLGGIKDHFTFDAFLGLVYTSHQKDSCK